MRWTDVVAAYPNQWLVVEALEAHVEVVEPPLARGSSVDLEAVPEPLAHPALGFHPESEDEPSDGTIAAPIADPSKTTAVGDHGWTFRRVLHQVQVLEVCADGRAAMHASREYARGCGTREVLCVHTSYPSLHFEERVMPRRRKGPSERMRATR